MSKQDDPIEIRILSDETPPPSVAPTANSNPANGAVNAAAQKVSQAAQGVAHKAWESDARKKVTDKVGEAAAKQKDAISEAVSKAINERIDTEKERMKRKVRETDWKEVAKTGVRLGLKGLSAGVGLLANKLKPAEKPTDSSQEQPPTINS